MSLNCIFLGAIQAVPVRFPSLFFIAGSGLIALLVEIWFKRTQSWAIPSAFLYLTVFAWYFADLYITPESYDSIPDKLLNFCYVQIMIFLGVYRGSVSWVTTKLAGKPGQNIPRQNQRALQTLFMGTVALWLVLMMYGVARMGGDVVGALLPLDARAGNTMWARAGGAEAGPTGFIVSTANYIHLLVCASFGVWFFFLRGWLRIGASLLIMISWPYFLLSGTRSIFLAVAIPFFFAYLLFAKQKILFKIAFLFVSFLLVNVALHAVTVNRDIGFRHLFSSDDLDGDERDNRHQGLNMIQELAFTNIYELQKGPEYGGRYLTELCNVIPRAIWPSKPLINVDYSIWRGFGGGENDIGVVATISTGMIGGGVLNFGEYFGPSAAAFLMALWTGLLARWWRQRASFLRCFLFLAGLGLTFNLGRDITLLVLWPIIFGYLLVRLAESFSMNEARTSKNVRRAVRPKAVTSTTLRPALLAGTNEGKLDSSLKIPLS